MEFVNGTFLHIVYMNTLTRGAALSALFFLCIGILFSAHNAHAQQSAGVRIIPAMIEEGADPGDTFEERITVTNVSEETQTYYVGVRDISGVRNENQPIFAEEGMERTGFELSEWVTFEEESFTLGPNEETSFPIQIQVPDNASPGSHFGGIFVTVEPPRLRTIGAGIGYNVGSIISIRISGDIIESARIRSFATDRLVYSEPNVTFTTRVENAGNVLVRPRGLIEVTNMFGRDVGDVIVNDGAGGVFPGTTRSFAATWEGDGMGFGRYEAVVALAYGEEGRRSTIDATMSFWILPLNIILPILGVLILIIAGLYIAIRLHIRNSVQRVTTRGGRRVVMQRRRRDRASSKLVMVAIALLVTVLLFLIGILVLFT